MSETLEAIARALFKSWFVDFEPVRAKGERREAGLPRHLDKLMPESFDDSLDLPTGWKPATIADYATLNPENWSKETYPDTITYVDLANTKWDESSQLPRINDRTLRVERNECSDQVTLLSGRCAPATVRMRGSRSAA